MGIDCETVSGYGVIVDLGNFLKVMGISDDEWGRVVTEEDPWQYVEDLTRMRLVGPDIAFHYNGYDEMFTVFVATKGLTVTEGGKYAKLDLASLMDGSGNLVSFLCRHFPMAGEPALISYSYTTA